MTLDSPLQRQSLNVVITVDTEPSIAGTLRHPDRHSPVFGGPVEGNGEALNFLLQTLSRHRLTATFFVEALHTRYFGDSTMAACVERIVAAGQDLGLHVHPCWRAFENGKLLTTDVNDDARGRTLSEQTDLFAEARAIFERWGFGRPLSARTGNFSTDEVTFAAMRDVGVNITSNVCAASRNVADELKSYTNGAAFIHGVFELPVTCFTGMRANCRPGLRPFQVTSATSEELIRVLESAYRAGLKHVVLLTHPFEFIKTASIDYRNIKRNRINQNRFSGLCQFLETNNDRFNTVPMSSYQQDRKMQQADDAVELRLPLHMGIKRNIENYLNDHWRAF